MARFNDDFYKSSKFYIWGRQGIAGYINIPTFVELKPTHGKDCGSSDYPLLHQIVLAQLVHQTDLIAIAYLVHQITPKLRLPI